MKSIDLLKDKKIKVTQARILIMDLLIKTEISTTAEAIYSFCIKEDRSINLSTVYRTLELLEKKDIIEKFDLGDGRYSYTFKRDKHKHILECSMCHKEIEIECPMKQIEEIIKTKTGFTMVEHNLMIKGICDQCKKDTP